MNQTLRMGWKFMKKQDPQDKYVAENCYSTNEFAPVTFVNITKGCNVVKSIH